MKLYWLWGMEQVIMTITGLLRTHGDWGKCIYTFFIKFISLI